MISKAIRTATDAEFLNMVLYIPSEMTCSFSTPLFSVIIVLLNLFALFIACCALSELCNFLQT